METLNRVQSSHHGCHEAHMGCRDIKVLGKLRSTIHSSVLSLTFTECLPCSRQCERGWGCSSERDRACPKGPPALLWQHVQEHVIGKPDEMCSRSSETKRVVWSTLHGACMLREWAGRGTGRLPSKGYIWATSWIIMSWPSVCGKGGPFSQRNSLSKASVSCAEGLRVVTKDGHQYLLLLSFYTHVRTALPCLLEVRWGLGLALAYEMWTEVTAVISVSHRCNFKFSSSHNSHTKKKKKRKG